MQKNKKGKFIIIEGGEGSGKTTLVNLAKEHFKNLKVTREPGGSIFAEMIRSIILSPEAKTAHGETQFGLFWAARFDHIQNTILPTVRSGKNVLSDRFDSSSFVYQMYGQEAMHLKELFFKMREIYLRDCKPDLYIFLDVPPEVGLARVAKRKELSNHFDERTLDFHKRIYDGYQEFLSLVPHIKIDATQSLGVVKANFLSKLKKALK